MANVEYEYDVYFPTDAVGHTGTTVTISGKALSALGTAFQMEKPASAIAEAIRTWSSGAVQEGTCKFYACNPKTGTIAQSGSTANGHGHWFSKTGIVTSYGNGYVYSEFTPSALSFYVGQYPGKSKSGDSYRIAQAIRYKKNGQTVQATFYFNIHLTDGETKAELTSITEHTQPKVVYEKGDVNLDGNIDISDIVAIINTIAGDTTYKDTADVNEDKNIDISDIVAVINIIASK